MIGIEGGELTFRHHIGSYVSNYGVWYNRTGNKAPYGGIVDEKTKSIKNYVRLELERKINGHSYRTFTNPIGIAVKEKDATFNVANR